MGSSCVARVFEYSLVFLLLFREKVLTGSFDKSARLWSSADGSQEKIYWGHVAEIVDVQFSPDELILATASLDGTAKIFQTATGRLKKNSPAI